MSYSERPIPSANNIFAGFITLLVSVTCRTYIISRKNVAYTQKGKGKECVCAFLRIIYLSLSLAVFSMLNAVWMVVCMYTLGNSKVKTTSF